MKVIIKPYNNWYTCRVYTNYMFKKYKKYRINWPEPGNESLFESSLEHLENIIQWIYNHTVNLPSRYRKRKIKVHIDDFDTWNASHTLAHIILPTLKKLKESKYGSPYTEYEDVPPELRPDPTRKELCEKGEIESWDIDNTIHERWDWIINEMIYAFECFADENWDSQFHSGDIDFQTEELVDEDGEKKFRLVKGPNDTHVFDKEGYESAVKRRDNGMRLFAKYYQSLWT